MASRCSQVSVIRPEIDVERNPLRSFRRKRTKKIAVAVPHFWPNLGASGAIRLAALRAFSALPTEITFSSTFPGIHRYIWRVDSFPIEPKGSPGKTLAITIVNLPTCTGCKWVFRLRGFANCKNDQAYRVAGEYRGNSTLDSDDFPFGILGLDANLSSRTFTARKHPSNATNPEPDWSSDVASARLRLGESIPIDDASYSLKVGADLRSSALVRGKPTDYARTVKALSRIQFRARGRTVLRTGRIVTLHPWEGTVGKPASAIGERSLHPIDSVSRGSVRKPAYTCVNAGAGRVERWRCSMRKT
jgi:hypothetical protein